MCIHKYIEREGGRERELVTKTFELMAKGN